MHKIVIIGGGSVLWTPRLCCDMFLEPALDGSEIVIVDIDAEAAKLCKTYLEECVRRQNVHWTISIAELDDALKGADAVVVSLSTGGFEMMECDYSIPGKYGVNHSVGDTTGPGGIFRTLRNAPVFFDFAERMALLCPDAWMVHVTNPLSQITRLVSATGLVRCCGLCHEVPITFGLLRKFFGVESENDIDATCVGVNHFTLLKDLVVKGVKEPMSQLTVRKYVEYVAKGESESSGTIDDLLKNGTAEKLERFFNFWLAEHLGYFPAAGSPHIAENFPRFLNDEAPQNAMKIWRKGVMPWRPQNKLDLTQKLRDTLAKGEMPPELAAGRSYEPLASGLVGLLTGEPRRIIATLPNSGQISNLPKDAAVETWAVASRNGINPMYAGDVPLQYYGFMASVVAEQELTIQAAFKKDRRLVQQALFASPLLHQKERAEELMNEMFAAEKEWFDW